MNNQQNNTQDNVKMCNERGEIKLSKASNTNDLFSLNYNGELIITTRERLNKQDNYVKKLKRDIEIILEEKEKIKEINKNLQNQLAELNQINEKMKIYAKNLGLELEKTRAELNKFKQNQGGRKSKLTEQDKQNIIRAVSNGWSIAQVYEQFIKMGRDVSYETIRRFVAEIRSAKKPN